MKYCMNVLVLVDVAFETVVRKVYELRLDGHFYHEIDNELGFDDHTSYNLMKLARARHVVSAIAAAAVASYAYAS